MRAIWMLVLIAIMATGCSADSPPDVRDTATDQQSAPGDDDSPTSDAVGNEGAVATGARTLGEPSDQGDSESDGDIDGDTEALAFEDPLDAGSTPIESSGAVDDADDADDAADPDDPTPTVEDTELSRLVTQLIAFVEAERGHQFEERPSVNLLETDAFNAAWNSLVAADADEFASDYVDFTDIYRATGILDGSATLEEIWMRFGDAGVLGYYDPDTREIVLRAGEITAFTKTVLVHELVHALDDQIFGIDRDEYADRTDEIDWTFSALIEGSAGVIEERYRATLTQAERDEEVRVQRALPRTVSLAEFSTSFLELQFGRYRYGDAFAAALWDEGQGAIDAAFIDPPATSEVVIDPVAFGSNEEAQTVASPPADGPIFRSGVWGEAAWAALFADVVGVSEGRAFADGWGGDAFVAWRTDGQTCMRAHIVADTADDLDDYAVALEEWARQAAGRDVFYPTADLVRVTACG